VATLTAAYFMQGTVPEAIAALARERYFDPGKNKPSVADFEAFIGTEDPTRKRKNDDAAGRERFVGRALRDDKASWQIGDAGKIRAVLCLRPLLGALDFSRAPQKALADNILGEPADPVDNLLLSFLIATSTQHMSDIISKTSEKRYLSAVPPSPHLAFLDKTIEFIAEGLVAEDAVGSSRPDILKQGIRRVLEAEHTTPAACARAICAAIGVATDLAPDDDTQDAAAWPFSWFEKDIQDYVDEMKAAPTEARREDLFEGLDDLETKIGRTRPGAPRTILLSGPEESGKKAIVGDFLSQREEGGDYRFKLITTQGQVLHDMPILVLSVRVRDYRSLCQHVLAFLRRQDTQACTTIEEQPEDTPQIRSRRKFAAILADIERDFGDNVPMSELWEAIKTDHKRRPGLFVFLDANDLSRGSQSRVMHRRGLGRLLDALMESNRASRVLITSSDSLPTTKAQFREAEKCPVQMPRMESLKWYLATDRGRRTFVSAQRLMRSSTDKRVPGDILAVFAALADLGLPSFDFATQFKECLAALPDTDETFDRMHPAYDRASLIAYRKYADTLREREVLPAITLVAAATISRDSLLDRSLAQMHHRLCEKLPDQVTHPYETLEAPLVEVVGAARAMIVRRGPNVLLDPNELGAGEEPLTKGPPRSWEMGRTAAIWLLRTMYSKETEPGGVGGHGNLDETTRYAYLARSACREIARGARRRAQIMRLRKIDAEAPAARKELARDIQCLEMLLASLPPQHGESIVPLRDGADRIWLRAPSVFALDDESFRADVAFRFAYFVLMRSDIDPAHQLSMRYDFDTTRLRCYLLILLGWGRFPTWSVDAFREPDVAARLAPALPREFPEPVLYALGREEALELLLSISIAAFHCQLPEVMEWSWRLHRSLIDPETDNDRILDIHARHGATVLDMSIRLGRPMDDREGTLADVLDLCTALIDDVGRLPDSNAQTTVATPDVNSDPGALPKDRVATANHQAALRLGLRQAHLNALTVTTTNPQKEYLELRKYHEQGDLGDRQQDSSVLTSGRSGRIYGRLLLSDFPVKIKAPADASLDIRTGYIAEHMLDACNRFDLIVETNLSRMNRFAGMDRIGNVADRLRVELTLGVFRRDGMRCFRMAEWYMGVLEEQMLNSSISEAAQLDLSLLQAASTWLMTWVEMSDPKALPIKESTGKRNKQAARVSERAAECAELAKLLGYETARIDAFLLEARANVLKQEIIRRTRKGSPDFDRVRDALRDVQEWAQRIGYGTAQADAMAWMAWIEERPPRSRS